MFEQEFSKEEPSKLAPRVRSLLAQHAFALSDEKVLQNDIARVFDNHGLQYQKEFYLSSRDIIDFFFEDGTGVEIKIKGQRMSIYRQLCRYAESDQIKKILLVTAISIGMPNEINGKPIEVLSLGRAHL